MIEVQCEDDLAATRAWAATHGLTEKLEKSLKYLSDYGNIGLPDGAANRIEHRCVLSADFAPHSFGVDMYRPGKTPGEWAYAFSGGLIYQGPDSPANGGAPSFTVSLARGIGWFLHT